MLTRLTPPAPHAAQAPLDVGDDAFVILKTDKKKSGRATVAGVARVRVVSIDATTHGTRYVVVVVQATDVRTGTRLELGRFELYSAKDRKERRAFGELARFYWSQPWRGERAS